MELRQSLQAGQLVDDEPDVVVERRRPTHIIEESNPDVVVRETKMTTLSGGSLGSCVDEERSQLRELM